MLRVSEVDVVYVIMANEPANAHFTNADILKFKKCNDVQHNRESGGEQMYSVHVLSDRV